MSIHATVGGVVKTVSKVPVTVGGVVKEATTGVCGVGGVVKQFFSNGLVLYDNGTFHKDLTVGEDGVKQTGYVQYYNDDGEVFIFESTDTSLSKYNTLYMDVLPETVVGSYAIFTVYDDEVYIGHVSKPKADVLNVRCTVSIPINGKLDNYFELDSQSSNGSTDHTGSMSHRGKIYKVWLE